MTKLTVADLARAAELARKLAKAVDAPPVVAGALALAAHGYQRETHDVDLVIDVVIGSTDGLELEEAALKLRLLVKTRHRFGGIDLREADDDSIRIDVLTLDNEMPGLVAEAVRGATQEIDVFGQRFLAVSIGHLLCFKLIAYRKKDIGDITELIKARISTWEHDWAEARAIVRKYIGYGGVKTIERLEYAAKGEL